MTSVFKRSARPGVANEADYHARNSLATRIKALSLPVRMSVFFAGAFTIGFVIEAFACSTGLYQAVLHKKTQRRFEMDEMVFELRENVAKWQADDIRIAEENAKAVARLAAASKP